MTYNQYKDKREGLMMSSAPIEVREEAIRQLDESYLVTESTAVARDDFYESASDPAEID